MVRRIGHEEVDASPSAQSSIAVENVAAFYEGLLGEMESRFKECLEAMEKSYLELEGESKVKDKKIKDLKQKR
jgi:hypothetical protein